jgi:(+)-(1E,4E,6S,7R)-germacra-1(10),4-dien-6-ol synthase
MTDNPSYRMHSAIADIDLERDASAPATFSVSKHATALLGRMPSFYCPIESRLSPHASEAEAAVLDWADYFELFETTEQRDYLRRARFPLFPAMSLPDADPLLLALAGKEVMWLQSFDDVFSDEREEPIALSDYVVLLGKLARMLEDPDCDLLPDNRWAAALQDLRRAIADRVSPVLLERWIRAHIDYFDGLLWEAAGRTKNRPLSLDDYVAMWLKQSGVYPCIAFTDLACGYEVPSAAGCSPNVRKLREMTSVIIGWDNDLTSYNKEAHRAASRGFASIQNLVAVIASERACSVTEAGRLAGAMRDHAMRRFVQLRDTIVKEGDAATARYAEGLGQWIRGYLDYSAWSPRYVDPLDDGLEPGKSWSIGDRPLNQASDLPAIAALSGWW